jgi:hypothetical protein
MIEMQLQFVCHSKFQFLSNNFTIQVKLSKFTNEEMIFFRTVSDL